MVPGSRALFIVGFERCATTSLAQYLVDSGIPLLVPGVKEPYLFLFDEARAVIERTRGMALDASVVYIQRPDALRRIVDTVEDYRIVVCLRDPIARTVSAFNFYRAALTDPDRVIAMTYGDERTRARLAKDRAMPDHLRRLEFGRHAYTSILVDVAGVTEAEADAAIETFAGQTFGERLLYELREHQRSGRYPLMSVLLNSHYPFYLRQMFKIVDPRRVMMFAPKDDSELARHNSADAPDSEQHRSLCRTMLGNSFAAESKELAALVSDFDIATLPHTAVFKSPHAVH